MDSALHPRPRVITLGILGLLGSVLTAATTAAEHLQTYTAGETRTRLGQIVTHSPETLADVVRQFGFVPAMSTWSGPDPEDLSHGYQRGDLIVTVYFDPGGADGGQLPCGLRTPGGQGIADFVKRRGKWMPDNDLARWMFTKRCR